MKKCLFGILLAAGLCLSSTPAQAGDFFATPKIGTLGFGLDLGYQVNDLFKVRLNGNYFGFSRDDSVNAIDYDLDLKNFTLGLLADIHPWRNGFRVTGGLYYLNLKGDLSGNLAPNKTYSFGSHNYTGKELGDASGSVKWQKLAPYLGIGWGTGASDPESNWFFNFDLGAMYIGKSKVSYSVSGLAAHPTLAADIEKEKDDIKSKIDKYNVYPVISIGVVYRF